MVRVRCWWKCCCRRQELELKQTTYSNYDMRNTVLVSQTVCPEAFHDLQWAKWSSPTTYDTQPDGEVAQKGFKHQLGSSSIFSQVVRVKPRENTTRLTRNIVSVRTIIFFIDCETSLSLISTDSAILSFWWWVHGWTKNSIAVSQVRTNQEWFLYSGSISWPTQTFYINNLIPHRLT